MSENEKPSASLRALHPGALPAEVAVPEGGLTVGRDARTTVILIRREGVSRRHCWIGRETDGKWTISDLNSRNGVFLNGHRIQGQHELAAGDVIGLGRSRLADLEFNINGRARQVALSGPGPWRIGRDLACELSLPADPGVSQQHALLRRQGKRLILEDRGSRNGTWHNGRRIQRSEVEIGDVIIAAGSRLVVVGSTTAPALEIRTIEQALGARASAVTSAPDGAHGLSFELRPGQLQALVINDREQRQNLLDLLSGLSSAQAGELSWSEPELNRDRARLRSRVGRIKTRDLPLCALTAAAWLEQQATLAAAGDLSAPERRERVAAVLAELDANHIAKLPLDRLTALEQALALIAAELLSNPGLLVIDWTRLLTQSTDRAELLTRLQVLAGPRRTVLLLHEQPAEGVPGRDHLDLRVEPASRTGNRIRSLLRPRGFSAAASGTLLRDQIRGWRRQPLMLLETLVLPIVLVAGLWLALPEQEIAWTLLVSLTLSSALAAAFQVSRRPGRLLRTARRHLLLDDAMLAIALAAVTIAAVQVTLGLLLITLLPGPTVAPALIPAAISGAIAGTALGLVCGVIARQRGELALLLVAVIGGLLMLAGSLAGFDSLAGWLLALVGPLPWSRLLADIDSSPTMAVLASGVLAVQIAGALLLARFLLRRSL